MITAIVTSKDKPIPTVIQQVIGKLSEEHTKILAAQHKIELDNAIEATRERGIKTEGNHLSDQIHVESIGVGEQKGYGVGNVETLNQKAPWWVWINFGRAGTGRTTPPSDIGSFTGMAAPSSGAKGGVWLHGKHAQGGNPYRMTPRKPIKAHNYIEKSLAIMLSKVRGLLK